MRALILKFVLYEYVFLSLKLVKTILSTWIKRVQNSQIAEHSESNEYWKIMFHVYLNIMETYMIIENTYQHMVRLLL